MKVLADLHHQGLYHSLYLLFEERLNWELYRPIGIEWYNEGYWLVYDHPATVEQFLGLYQSIENPTDIHGNLLPEHDRKNLHYTIEDGIYYVRDLAHETIHRAITLDKFKDTEFDIIISSIPQHVDKFNKLIRLYQPKAKHIFQVGNNWSTNHNVNNIMFSTRPFPTDKNAVFYHQEFDLNVFKYEIPVFHNIVNSYIHYMKRKDLMNHLANRLPHWMFNAYGGGMTKTVPGAKSMAEHYRSSAFTWHYKPGGDGYGHVIHASYACGRPALIWKKFYNNQLAENLFEDKVTCIDTSCRSIDEVAQLLKHYSQPDEHRKMCEAAHQRFNSVVDFDNEFEQIKTFLENLR